MNKVIKNTGSIVNNSIVNFAEREDEDEEEDGFSVVVETRQSFAKKYTTTSDMQHRSINHMALHHQMVRSSIEQDEASAKFG